MPPQPLYRARRMASESFANQPPLAVENRNHRRALLRGVHRAGAAAARSHPAPRKPRVRAERIPPAPQLIAALEGLLPNLRAKALELTGDNARADDLVQDALMRFWERGIRSTSPVKLKHWLRKVMRYMHIEYLRGSECDFFLTLPGERELQLEPDPRDES